MTNYYNTQNNDLLNIDLSQVDEKGGGFDAIPQGEYLMQATEVKLEVSKAGYTQVKAQFMVIGGQYNNRRIFESFGIQHPNSMEIAKRQLKQWVLACGLDGNARLTMAMLEGLVGAEFYGKVTVKKDPSGFYDDQNRLSGFKPTRQAAPQPQQAERPIASPAAHVPPPAHQPSPQRQAPAGQRPSMPWEGKRA